MRARLLPLLTAALAAPTWAAELNIISSLDLKDSGPEVVLTVKGTRKPSFTTFSMADPPRFVIDFSESRFQGVGDETAGTGVVKVVKALSYGTDASAIARVMLVFTAEVEPPAIEDAGGALVVRIAKPGGGGAAVAASDADAKAQPDADAQAKADAKARAKADADAAAKAKADADAKIQADAKAKADADAKIQADADAKAKADAEAQARADEEQRRAKADAKASADAKAKADAEAAARADDERRQAKAQADADAKAKADAEAAARADEERRQAQAKADAAASSTPDADAEADQKALEAEIAAAKAAKGGGKAKAEKASKPEPAAAPDDADQKRLDAEIAAARGGGKRKADANRSVETLSPGAPEVKVREVGFKQLAQASRVFVRTSSPAEFSVQDVDERTVRIQVQNTRASRYNDLRFLDTSFFSSAVQLITPSREGSSYVLTVKLRERVPYQQVKEGDLLAVDFQRPAATAAVTPPPGDAPDAGAPADEP